MIRGLKFGFLARPRNACVIVGDTELLGTCIHKIVHLGGKDCIPVLRTNQMWQILDRLGTVGTEHADIGPTLY